MNRHMELLDENRALPERIQKIREEWFDTKPQICVERARYYTESFKETEQYPIDIRRAMALMHIMKNITQYISEGELLVGGLSEKPRGASIYPEFSVDWIINEFNGDPYEFDKRPGDVYRVDPEVKRELMEEILPYWKGRTQEDHVMAMLPEETIVAGTKVRGFDGSWIVTRGDGHNIPDFEKILQLGCEGVIKQAEDKLASLDLTDPDDLRQRPFLQSVIISARAPIAYAERFSELAMDMAKKEPDVKRKKELMKIAENCKHVPARPARTFEEGLQSILIADIAVQLESNGHGVSFGRFDQYMYPLFRQDMDNGTLTAEYALELLNCFWMKINEMSTLRDWHNTKFFVGYLVYQNLTIGGQTLHGKDAVNELSYLCLASTKGLRMMQPSLTVRVFNNTEDVFLVECAKSVALGIGMPAFYNDEAIIPALLAIGYTREDAVSYGIVGCVEPAPPGKIGGRYGAAFPSPTKVLELTMHGGKDPRTGLTPLKCKSLTEVKDYDEFMEEYKKELEYYLRQHVIQDNIIDTVWEKTLPTPFLSALIDDCIGRGKGIKEGGAKYDFTGGQTVGASCAINGLAELKKFVFDEKKLTAEQMMHALDTNYEDNTTSPTGEEIRQMLLNDESKFGNDDEYADEIAAEFIDYWSAAKMKFKNTRYGRGPIGGHFIPSTATVASNVPAGEIITATPDGRKAYDHVSEGISAFRGSDKNGPTALINSIGSIPNMCMPGGQLLNVKLNPSSMKDMDGLKNFVALVKSLFAQKGFHVQFNVVGKDTLIEAKKDPEKYQDLIVRVAGYSAFFTTLAPEVQDDIIDRTEHAI
ncbi:glycyl radical protein [Christensenellaceae bacterium OttesenSCG-928-K19]|nr:glycyl radical protein [Christensenellaceae bacterium OttesenSCG-928-K19]